MITVPHPLAASFAKWGGSSRHGVRGPWKSGSFASVGIRVRFAHSWHTIHLHLRQAMTGSPAAGVTPHPRISQCLKRRPSCLSRSSRQPFQHFRCGPRSACSAIHCGMSGHRRSGKMGRPSGACLREEAFLPFPSGTRRSFSSPVVNSRRLLPSERPIGATKVQ